MEEAPRRGSLAATPDMDWSQVHETVLMLELAAVQIDRALKDGDASYDVLSQTFSAMAGYVRTQLKTLRTLSIAEEQEGEKLNLLETGEQVLDSIHQAIVAFQFYDRLGQRLTHVCSGLEQLTSLVKDRSRLFNPGAWVELQKSIRSVYSSPAEVTMFDAVISGMPIAEAVETYLSDARIRQDADIELF